MQLFILSILKWQQTPITVGRSPEAHLLNPAPCVPQDSTHGRSDSFDAESSAFINELNLPNLQITLNNHHIPQAHGFALPGNRNVATAHNSLNTYIARANEKQTNQRADFAQHHHSNHRTGPMELTHTEFSGTAEDHGKYQANNGESAAIDFEGSPKEQPGETWVNSEWSILCLSRHVCPVW